MTYPDPRAVQRAQRTRYIVVAALAGALCAGASYATAAPDPSEWERTGRPAPPRELLQPTLDAELPAYRSCVAHGRLEGAAPPIVVEPLDRWLRGFREREPGVEIDVPPPYLPPQGMLNPRLRAFLEGRLDFAFLTREMAASDLSAFRRTHGFDPLQVPVSGGSFRHFGFVDAVSVVVHESNPLRGLTIAQLDATFSCTRLRGHDRPIRTSSASRRGQASRYTSWATAPGRARNPREPPSSASG